MQLLPVSSWWGGGNRKGLFTTVPNNSAYLYSAYVGKGYGTGDEDKGWAGVANVELCKEKCKEMFALDNLWNSCAYGPNQNKYCQVTKNVSGFAASSYYDSWKLGENLFFKLRFISIFSSVLRNLIPVHF